MSKIWMQLYIPSLTVEGSSSGVSISACRRNTFPRHALQSIRSNAGILSLNITPATKLHCGDNILWTHKKSISFASLSKLNKMRKIYQNNSSQWVSVLKFISRTIQSSYYTHYAIAFSILNETHYVSNLLF